ncbi:MAG: hypothetical protein ACO3LE_07505 [Bdellovibrionota bacterium]
MQRSLISTMLQKLENWHNWASDTKVVWFPFLFLKLRPHQLLTRKRILIMTPCFATYFCFSYLLSQSLLGRTYSLQAIFENLGLFLLIFFVWFNLVTYSFWNRRARRLQKEASGSGLC